MCDVFVALLRLGVFKYQIGITKATKWNDLVTLRSRSLPFDVAVAADDDDDAATAIYHLHNFYVKRESFGRQTHLIRTMCRVTALGLNGVRNNEPNHRSALNSFN